MRPSGQEVARSRFAVVGTTVGVLVLLGVVLLSATACSCDGDGGSVVYATEVRTVTVTGTADVMVDPDQVVISVGVQATEDRPAAAKSNSDAAAQKVFQAASDHGVEDVDVQTEYVRVNPDYGHDYEERYGTDRRVIVGYTASQTIAITLKDLSEYEDLLTDLLDAGVEYVHGVNFETSELRKHRDEAREMAVEAAKEKATALADQLGQSLGEPAEIVENQVSSGPWYGGTGLSNAQLMASDEALAKGATVAPGQITVNASVTVTFELK